MLKYLISTTLLLALSSISAFAASDKWGGDDRVKNPTSLYQTGTATATGNFTLTDGSKSWDTNSLAGAILQPSTSAEVYYLIKSNTATEITVYGSDTAGNEELAHRHISNDNAGTGTYAILDRWNVQKVSQRWWLFDPFGNAFFAKSLNDFGVVDNRFGYSIDGIGYTTLMNNQSYGGHGTNAGGYTGNLFSGVVDVVKATGFNTLGSIIDAGYTVPGSCYNAYAGKTAARYFPFISQVRVNYYTLANTAYFTVNTDKIYDALDANFQTDVQNATLNGSGSSAVTEGYRLFDVAGCSGRTSWAANRLTPYEKAKYNIPANPYFIGFDWGEEPRYCQSESTNEHMGYRIITSAAGTPRKEQAVAVLTAKYTTIGALNTAWGTAYADWAALDADTGSGINAVLTNSPYCYYWRETNTAALADLNLIAEDFWRNYTKKVHDALDVVTAVHVLNYGPGYHGWRGDSTHSFQGTTSPEYLFRGSVSADGATPYIDIIGIGDPLHGPHQSMTPDFYEYMGSDLKSRYAFHGRPYHHESCWLTAEADSAIAYTGTIAGLTSSAMTTTGAHFDSTGILSGATTVTGTSGATSITLSVATTLYGNDVLVYTDDASAEQRIRITGGGSTPNTAFNTTALPSNVTGKTFTIYHMAYAYAGVAPRRMMLLNASGHSPGSRTYYSVCTGAETNCPQDATAITDNTISRRYAIADSAWSWVDGSGDMTTQAQVGDTYSLISHDAFGQISNGSYSLYVPLTQADRGTMYAKFVTDTENLKAANGDSIIVGFSQFSWFDFSFKPNGTESRNFGFMTIKGNLYDGSATIGNGEVQDCGDFITPVKSALTNLYSNTMGTPDTTAPTITAFTMPSISMSLTVAVTTFTATDNVAVTDYCVTTTASSTGCTWAATAPATITIGAAGNWTFYAWARDAAGNVSAAAQASTQVTTVTQAPIGGGTGSGTVTMH